MKKFFKYFLIMTILLFTGCGKVTEKEAARALSKHLKARYNEEFSIGLIGRRSDGNKTWYEAEICPQNHIGDEYYYSSGNVNIKKSLFGERIDYVGDIYSLVWLNESANKFYLPKLKELFGENVLPIFETDVGRLTIKPDFYTTLKESKEENRILDQKGRIYIFGRVENNEDREWYREQIYKFVQFMKEAETFEYVKLGIYIIDERILAGGALEYIKSLEEIKDVNKDFKPLNEKLKNTSKENIQEKINSFPKKDTYKILNEYHGYLLSADIFTLKGMQATFNLSDKGDLEWICKYYGGIKEYEKLQDVEFEDEVAKKNIEVKEIFPAGHGIYINDKLVFKGIWDYQGEFIGRLSRDEKGILTYTYR